MYTFITIDYIYHGTHCLLHKMYTTDLLRNVIGIVPPWLYRGKIFTLILSLKYEDLGDYTYYLLGFLFLIS